MENSFGSLLRASREKEGISLRKLKDRLGITASAIFYFEKGLSYPNDESLKKICDELNINLKIAGTLIKEEREKRKLIMGKRREFGLTSARYPSLRELLINSYKCPDKDCMRVYNLIQELKKYPFHSIEKEILNAVVKIFTKENLIKPGFGVFELLTEKAKNDLKDGLKKISFSWTYNPTDDELEIIYYKSKKNSNPVKQSITLKRRWGSKK